MPSRLNSLGLHLDPVGGEFPAFAAEFVDRHLVLVLAPGAVLLLDLPLDRQSVAVPAGNIVAVVAAHLEGTGDDVLEDLVQRMADMDVAVGIGWTVMQHVFRPAAGGFAQFPVEVEFLPAADKVRFHLGQPGPHRKIGLRQKERLGIIGFFGRFGHDLSGLSCSPRARPTGESTQWRPNCL